MTQDIIRRRLGKTDLEVSPIGLGAMQFSGGKGPFRFFLSALPPETQNEIVQVAINSGMNWIDTAEIYGGGESERAVSAGLKYADSAPGDTIIATKWSPILKRAKSISKSARKSTVRLEPYPIDLYQVHQPWSFSSMDAQMNEMADLVDEGIVRSIGVSNFGQEKMVLAHEILEERGIPLASNQVKYSLLHRNIENNSVLDTAKELGITIIAYTPLGQGILSGKFHRNPELLKQMPRFRARMLRRNLKKSQPLVEALEAIALEHDATAAQIALNWAVNYHGETIVAIPGASKTVQAEQNAGAMRIRLSSEQLETVNSLCP
ncbi:MAG: aldo/keto reductase [Candidatus Thorarchaeota archaeon]|jgi:aryl-alcohol dehydrogenase-like predicted oxidoreductase